MKQGQRGGMQGAMGLEQAATKLNSITIQNYDIP